MSLLSEAVNAPTLVTPLYSVYQYTDGIYKVVKFKSQRPLYTAPRDKKVIKEESAAEPRKWASSVSRARRVILELALCNHWEYFCTFTLDKQKYDRFNLEKFYNDFSQFIRDQRKKTGCAYKYVFIPEMHEDGAWHIHGFMSGIPGLVSFKDLFDRGIPVPLYLVHNGYYEWSAYSAKFGFCSFGAIRNPISCGFYVTKYVGKGLEENQVPGRHLYRASLGLNRAQKFAEYFHDNPCLDYFLSNDYEFCKTGMTHEVDGLDWSAMLELTIDPAQVQPIKFDEYGLELTEADYYMDAVQTALEEFL